MGVRRWARFCLCFSLVAIFSGQTRRAEDPPQRLQGREVPPEDVPVFVELGPAPLAPDLPASASRQASVVAPAAAGWFDTSNRASIRNLYLTVLAATRTTPTGWTGSLGSCNAGDISAAYKTAVAQRIDWIRGMAGVPTGITLNSTYNAKDQKAALVFSANKSISHYPPSNWSCYSADAYEAAGKSNICLSYGGAGDPGCVEQYMKDAGSSNTSVGHRRWILYPQTTYMGTGDVPQTGTYPGWYPFTNALWVINPEFGGPRPATRDTWVAWPPKGYVPYQVVYPRWSFAWPNADFTNATITMTRNGTNVPLQKHSPANGYGENTVVWVPDGLNANDFQVNWPKPSSDTTIHVKVANFTVSGVARTQEYDVIVFDPDTGGGSAPGTPSNPSPANNATGVALSPTLTWTGGSGATSHDVYFGTSSNPPLLTNVAGTSVFITSLSAGTRYYWRVVAKNAYGSTTSATWSFVTLAMPYGLGVSPSSGNHSTTTFSASYGNLLGYTQMQWVQLLFASSPTGGGQSFCFVHYDVQGHAFWLYSDVFGFFMGPVTPGAASNALQGSLCALKTSASSVTRSGNWVTMNAALVFKQTAVRNVYVRARGLDGADTNWQYKGAVTLQSIAALTGLTSSPSSGTGSSQLFTLTYPDPAGFQGYAFGWVQFLIAAATNGGGQPFCYVHYDRAANKLWQYSSDTGYFLGPATPGTSYTGLNSSACSVDVAASSVTPGASGLTLRVKLNLKAPMKGAKKQYMRIYDALNRDSGHLQSGTWTIP